MRKQSREMPALWAMDVLLQAPYVTLSLTDAEGHPYGVPLSIAMGSDGDLYFHCAQEGKKLDLLRAHPEVSLSAVSRCHPIVGPKDGSFTLEYKSAIARGRAEEVFDPDAKREALRHICQRYLPQHMAQFESAVERSLERTAVVRIHLTEPPTGKRKQYDANGEELKYGRME